MKNIIDDHINKNIELYYAFIQFVSFITLQKISTIETRKKELENQMKNSQQKNPTNYYPSPIGRLRAVNAG
ncbi:DNA mismatch repair protein MutT [Bacillus cereus group sp. N31]|uniref:DNA mismatch repair protein MutT n=1 Tax=Bacillus cereus group TaxID=86661 RepID=UPI001155CF80|nr:MULTISPECIES: DNA mismatch repair protein MutT [Bacillus cereus group]MBJ7932574.1 DNA mismatch repair protein MutT [Bacillus cereus group sp. N31]QWH88473.1 DNA mismatch repair protein MutT [Bacillus toyonensis]QWI31648.1 DNA mismatch repair protein MutT [Bacillus toyonensis]